MHASPDAAMKELTNRVLSTLAPMGFKKRGNTARLVKGDNVALVSFQRSQDSTREKVKFTVNLAIVFGKLLDPDSASLANMRDVDGHLRQRIGSFMEGSPDKWWIVDELADLNEITTEVSNLLVEKVAPFLIRYIRPDEIISLWKSGQSPGLTDRARIRNLANMVEYYSNTDS
jgi:hypothetical protein